MGPCVPAEPLNAASHCALTPPPGTGLSPSHRPGLQLWALPTGSTCCKGMKPGQNARLGACTHLWGTRGSLGHCKPVRRPVGDSKRLLCPSSHVPGTQQEIASHTDPDADVGPSASLTPETPTVLRDSLGGPSFRLGVLAQEEGSASVQTDSRPQTRPSAQGAAILPQPQPAVTTPGEVRPWGAEPQKLCGVGDAGAPLRNRAHPLFDLKF